jgi:hypothetical protein
MVIAWEPLDVMDILDPVAYENVLLGFGVFYHDPSHVV